jgi:hypothetical protein
MDVISGVIPNDKGEYINVPASWRERKHEVEEIAAAEKQQQQDAERSHRVSVSSATSTSDSLQEQVPGPRSKVQPTDGYMLLEDEESQSRAKPNLILVILVQFAMFLKRGLAQQYKQPATISFDFLLVLVIALSMGLIFSNLSYIDAPSPTQFADAINATNTFEGLFSCKDSQLLMLTLSNAMLIPLADEICKCLLKMEFFPNNRHYVRSVDSHDDTWNLIGCFRGGTKDVLTRKGSLFPRICRGRVYYCILFGQR